MKVRVKYQADQVSVDEFFSGKNAEEIVRQMQSKVASKVNFVMRIAVHALSPLQFAQEAVRRYNDASKKNLPIPQTCDEFLKLGQNEGIVTIFES
jgi:hypothetical protein